MKRILFALGFVFLLVSPGFPQEALPPNDLEAWDNIAGQMQFKIPTRIAGRLLTFDTYEEAIWIQWTKVFNGRRWLVIPTERRLIVYPRDAGMWDFFHRLPPGTVLRMTIQTDEEGKRRVLKLDGT
ncbi:MAG: hypothetical protein ACREI3_09960 [Nitrospirales bacterium]